MLNQFKSLKAKLIFTTFVPTIGFILLLIFSIKGQNQLGEMLKKDHEVFIPNIQTYEEVLQHRFAIGYYMLHKITGILNESIKKVEDIAKNTKTKVDVLAVHGKEKVEYGIITASKCSDALNEIVKNVEKVNGLVVEISKATEEQALGVKEINKAMSKLDGIASTNNHISEQVSVSASELKGEVEKIRSVVLDLNKSVNG